MGSFHDYLDWRGDLSFEQVGLNEVDCLILAYFSYLDLEGIVPDSMEDSITVQEAARLLKERLTHETKEQMFAEANQLFFEAGSTPRFANCQMRYYINHHDYEESIQFSAVSIQVDSDKLFVSYSGTDDTILGWKENLNMSYLEVVPAQREAHAYLEMVGSSWPHKLVCGGHSKGGNLAVYATAMVDPSVRSRVYYIFDFDGPGYGRYFAKSEEYQNVRGRIRKIVPETSIVGILLEHEKHFDVVKTNEKGFMRNHFAYSWEILGPNFVRVEGLSEQSRLAGEAVSEWLDGMNPKECEQCCNTLSKLLDEAEIRTVYDLGVKTGKWNTVLKEYKNLDEEQKKMFDEALKSLRKIITENSAQLPIGKTLGLDLWNLVFKK